MPGSIRMATAPALNSAKTSEMKSMPGRTSRASRVPGDTPNCAQPPGDPVAVLVQLAEGDVPVVPLALGVVAQRLDHGDGVGPGLGHRESRRATFSDVVHHDPHHGKRTRARAMPGGCGYAFHCKTRHGQYDGRMDLSWLGILLGLPSAWRWTPLRCRSPPGMAVDAVTPRHVFRLGFHFGLFQFMMPIVGWLAGQAIGGLHRRLRPLGGVRVAGLRRRQDALGSLERRRSRESNSDPTRGLRLVTLSVATSIDALAVGMSMAFLGVSVWLPSVVIGMVTATLTTIGITFGSRIGSRWGRWAEVAGGIVLILIGFKDAAGAPVGLTLLRPCDRPKIVRRVDHLSDLYAVRLWTVEYQVWPNYENTDARTEVFALLTQHWLPGKHGERLEQTFDDVLRCLRAAVFYADVAPDLV